MGRNVVPPILRDSDRFGTVYIMAPMVMYGKKSLAIRKHYLENALPGTILLYPDELFTSNSDWLESIDGLISDCDCGILVSEKNRIVGYGCFVETKLLKSAGKPVFYLHYARKILTREFFLYTRL